MAIPEQQPSPTAESPVQETPEQVTVSETASSMGVQAVPVAPQPLQGANNQTIAQPVPAPADPKSSVTVPAVSQQALEDLAKGSAADSKTWFGVFWLFKIEKALKKGFSVLFGGK